MGLRYNPTPATATNTSTVEMYLGDGTINITTSDDFIAIQHNNIRYYIKPDLKNNGLIIGTDGYLQAYGATWGGNHDVLAQITDGGLYGNPKIVKLYSTLPFIEKALHRYNYTDTKVTYGGEDEDSLSAYLKPLIQKLCQDNNITYNYFNNLSLELQYLTSPLARSFNLPTTSTGSHGLADDDILLCKDLDEVSISLFGVSQPKLKKLLMRKLFSFSKDQSGTLIHFQVSDGMHGLIKCIAKAFTIDIAYNIISEVKTRMFDSPDETHAIVYANFFKTLGYQYSKKLLLQEPQHLGSGFNDVVWQWERYREGKLNDKLINKGMLPIALPKKCKTFTELHDKVSAEYNKIRAVDEFKFFNYKTIKQHGILKELHKDRFKDYTIIFPENSVQLVHWGRDLNNCISSYVERVISDKTMVFALYKDGVITNNVEVQYTYVGDGAKGKFKIVQYVGNKNQDVGDLEKKQLADFIQNRIKTKVLFNNRGL